MSPSLQASSEVLQGQVATRCNRVAPARRKVLVIDDDDELRALLEETLREEGYEVAQACDTLTGFILLLVEGADVVILDWKMPDLDGFELLGSARRCFPTLPVIFITAFAGQDVYDRAMQNGAFGFLSKPFPLEDFLLEVEGALHPLARGRTTGRSDTKESGL